MESRNRLRRDGTIALPASFKSFGGILSGPVDFLVFSAFILSATKGFGTWTSVYGGKHGGKHGANESL